MTTEAEMVSAKNTTFVLDKGEYPATEEVGLEAKGLEGILKKFEEMGIGEK